MKLLRVSYTIKAEINLVFIKCTKTIPAAKIENIFLNIKKQCALYYSSIYHICNVTYIYLLWTC